MINDHTFYLAFGCWWTVYAFRPIIANVYRPRQAKRGVECSSHALRLNSSLYKSLRQSACFLMESFCFVNIEGLFFAAHPCSC